MEIGAGRSGIPTNAVDPAHQVQAAARNAARNEAVNPPVRTFEANRLNRQKPVPEPAVVTEAPALKFRLIGVSGRRTFLRLRSSSPRRSSRSLLLLPSALPLRFNRLDQHSR